MVNQYIPGDETSFTIIAFPVPAIGKDFAEIFHETIRINTLDYEEYKKIQQNLVDVLDLSLIHIWLANWLGKYECQGSWRPPDENFLSFRL